MKIYQKIIIMLVFSSGIACSFQSKQYNLLRNTLSSSIMDAPSPDWVIDWTGMKINVFAINTENQIFFADYEDHFLVFDGWQIIQAVGFFPQKNTVKIEFSDNNLSYILNEKILITDACESWSASIDTKTDFILHRQICYATGTDYNYTNLIFVNNDNKIIALKYKIHPNYPSIELIMNEYTYVDLNR